MRRPWGGPDVKGRQLQLEAFGGRRRLMVFGAALAVAIAAAACLPPPPPPPPAPATKPPVTTTTKPPPPQCPTGTSVLENDTSAAQPPGNQYTAVVKHAGRTKVLVRTAGTPAEVDQFHADATAQGEVLAFAQDNEVHALDTQTETWGFTDTGFRASWTEAAPTPTSGTGIRVAVLDTGVDATHPDVEGHFDAVPGLDLVNLCQNPATQMVPTPGVTTDPNGHGTHVSGIIAASDNGFGVVGGAPGVTLVPVRVLGTGGSGSYSDVAAGILWAADKTKGNASVISMSLGGGNDGGVISSAIATVESDPAYTHPVILVAAGNNSASAPEYPAVYASTYPEVLPVAALCKPNFPSSTTDRCSSSTETIASFSSHPWSGSGLQTGVSAPGVAINSTYPGGTYTTLSGTSMATPFVAALAALLVAHCPADTPSQIVARIEQVAATHDLGAPGVDTTYGYGQIDAETSVEAC
jgi:serine protease